MASAMNKSGAESAEHKRHDADVAKRAAVYVTVLHGATGMAIGVLVGFVIWSRLVRPYSYALDSWAGFVIVVGGFTLAFTVLAACLKERFWTDWRSPFRW